MAEKRDSSIFYLSTAGRFTQIECSRYFHVSVSRDTASAASGCLLLQPPSEFHGPLQRIPGSTGSRHPTSSGPESWAAPVLISINRRRQPAKSIKTTIATASLRRAPSADTLFAPQSRPWPAPWLPLFFRPAPPIISGVAASRQTPVLSSWRNGCHS